MAQNWTIEQIEQRVRALDPWFHNLNLHGIQTAPDHFLGDFPRVLWPYVADVLSDVSGRTVLDVGCNAGFYAIEAKRRGAWPRWRRTRHCTRRRARSGRRRRRARPPRRATTREESPPGSDRAPSVSRGDSGCETMDRERVRAAQSARSSNSAPSGLPDRTRRDKVITSSQPPDHDWGTVDLVVAVCVGIPHSRCSPKGGFVGRLAVLL